MSVTSVIQCRFCQAMANERWPFCLACGKALVREAGPILAVKIVNSLIGEFWIVLSDDEPFDPSDGLPRYRPSEIRALKAKGYGPEALAAVHRVKSLLDGRILS